MEAKDDLNKTISFLLQTNGGLLDDLVSERQKVDTLTAQLEEAKRELLRVKTEDLKLNLKVIGERDSLRKQVEELRKATHDLIAFLPEGWPMPLGWKQFEEKAWELADKK
jgi:chromosome segregation ATPase